MYNVYRKLFQRKTGAYKNKKNKTAITYDCEENKNSNETNGNVVESNGRTLNCADVKLVLGVEIFQICICKLITLML